MESCQSADSSSWGIDRLPTRPGPQYILPVVSMHHRKLGFSACGGSTCRSFPRSREASDPEHAFQTCVEFRNDLRFESGQTHDPAFTVGRLTTEYVMLKGRSWSNFVNHSDVSQIRITHIRTRPSASLLPPIHFGFLKMFEVLPDFCGCIHLGVSMESTVFLTRRPNSVKKFSSSGSGSRAGR